MMKLTVKEEEVMEKIWQLGECTPRDVLALYEEPQPLITSISNTFQALERKGFLTHRSHEEKLSEAELLRFLADLMNSNQESS